MSKLTLASKKTDKAFMMDLLNWVLSTVKSQLAALAWTFHLQIMYIFRSNNRLEVSITLHLFKSMAEEVALIDSGTTKNFIDQETVKKLKLRSKKLSKPV